MKSFKPEVTTCEDRTKWVGNALRFRTEEEAELNVSDLMMRWTAVVNTRVVESDDNPNYAFIDGRLVGLCKSCQAILIGSERAGSTCNKCIDRAVDQMHAEDFDERHARDNS